MKNRSYLHFGLLSIFLYLSFLGYSQIGHQKVWQHIKYSYEPSDFENFIRTYPQSRFTQAAQRKLDSLKEIYAFYDAISSADTTIMQQTIHFLKNDSLKSELTKYLSSWKTWLASSFHRYPGKLKTEFRKPIDSLIAIYQDTAYFLIIHLMIAKLNHIRERHHIKPVKMNYALAKEAFLHAKAMSERNFLSHIDPIRGNPYLRAKRANFRGETVGENIAAGQLTIDDLFSDWMKSKHHRQNILNKTFNVAGMGFYISNNPKRKYTYIYVNLFGKE